MREVTEGDVNDENNEIGLNGYDDDDDDDLIIIKLSSLVSLRSLQMLFP